MHYAYPHLYWLSGLAGALTMLALLVPWRKRLALRRLSASLQVGPQLLVHRPIRLAKTLLLVAAAVLLGFVLVGPQWGHAEQEESPPLVRGRDLLILLDVSRSMQAEDVKPNRLEYARRDLRDLADKLEKEGGHRIGLVAFADRAALLCPLTADFACFCEELQHASLAGLRLRGDAGGGEGTQIGTALLRAEKLLDQKIAPYADVLLVSDGGDMDVDTLATADRLAQRGVPVHTVGVGNPHAAAPVPVQGSDGQRTLLRFRGEVVRVRLEEELLRQIASRTGGTYIATHAGERLGERLRHVLSAGRPQRELPVTNKSKLYVHRFQWFLAPAVVLLLLEMFLGEDRRKSWPALARSDYFVWVLRRQRRVERPAAPPPRRTKAIREGVAR